MVITTIYILLITKLAFNSVGDNFIVRITNDLGKIFYKNLIS